MAVKDERESLRFGNLILAIILAALATPIVKWLVMHGGKLSISNPDAISFCNILFVGNLCSGLVVLITFGWKGIWRHLRELTAKTSLLLTGNLLIGTVMAPIFLYIALETTMVTNLVLLTRIEAVVYSVLGVLLFKDPISKMNWIGLVFIAVGTIALALYQGGGELTQGDGLGILAGILYAVGSSMGRTILEHTSIYGFIFSRNLLGGIIFFWLAIILYGSDHFAEAFSAELWLVMTVYAGLVVVVGQITWFRAIASLSSGIVSAWSTLTPVLGILFAYLLLHEVPDMSQWMAAAVILCGMAISQIQPVRSVAIPRMVEKGLVGA
jgi:drug/metabolite transporter (DMT)-like permease